jgi:hypothetical protein
MKWISIVVTVIVLAVLVSGVLLAQSNPFVGTWKMNIAKTKYSPGPAPKSTTRTIEAQGSGEKASNEGTAADGSHIAWSYTASYDGKDNPISGTGPNGADTMALKRINANTIEATTKKAGKVVATARLVVSKDGKVTTITVKGTDASAPAVNNTIVFDKQ